MADMILGYAEIVAFEDDFSDEFVKWFSVSRGQGKQDTAKKYLSYFKTLTDPYQNPTNSYWHGLYHVVYGKDAEKNVVAIGTVSEFKRIYGDLVVALEKKVKGMGMLDQGFEKAIEWFWNPKVKPHTCITSALNAYQEFLVWREGRMQKIDEKSGRDAAVDYLTVALKLFAEARSAAVTEDVRYWTFSPGEQAGRWDEMREGGYIALDYSGTRDLREYADEEELRKEFQEKAGDETSHKNDVRALMNFREVMKPGDLVFAKKGTTTFLAVGRVTGDYEFAAEAPDYKHRRTIEWLKVKDYESEDAAAMKTLTDVTGYRDFVGKLCAAYDLDQSVDANATDWGCREVRKWFAAYDPAKFQDEFKDFRTKMIWSQRVRGQIGKNYAHVDELGALLAELKNSPRLMSYYASDEFRGKMPEGVGVRTVTDFLMKFHPDEYISFTNNMMDALELLGLWPKDIKREIAVSYNDLLGAATRVRNRMTEMGIGAYPGDAKPPADYITVNEFLWWVTENQDLIREKIMASVYKKTEITKVPQTEIGNFADFIKRLENDVAAAGLKYAPEMMKRFVCAQLAKPFTVLTGLSGSGKTKLAEAFANWIGVENTVNLVPVGADWTNNEKLLGYPNALDPSKYVMPDTGVLKLLLDADENPDLPFFLILDEMNLSHVERYFADFLSTMESSDGVIELYDSGERHAENGRRIPPKFPFPKNLFVIGTMNVDETTYMFSPKVLDRAQVIEFRVSEKEIDEFLSGPANPDMAKLAGKGAEFAAGFLELAKARKTKTLAEPELGKVKKVLVDLFKPLADLGSEFGYRSAIEIVTFTAYCLEASGYAEMAQSVDKERTLKGAIDAAVLQKLLPKLHGSLNHLMPVLEAMIAKVSKTQTDQNGDTETEVIYKGTYEKLKRMQTRLEKNGFTSFAEA